MILHDLSKTAKLRLISTPRRMGSQPRMAMISSRLFADQAPLGLHLSLHSPPDQQIFVVVLTLGQLKPCHIPQPRIFPGNADCRFPSGLIIVKAKDT